MSLALGRKGASRFCKPLVGSSNLSPGTSEIKRLGDFRAEVFPESTAGKTVGRLQQLRKISQGLEDISMHQRLRDRALALLAGSPNVAVETMVELINAGLATAHVERLGRPRRSPWCEITTAGRKTIG
jgi:hypothetical protein